MLLMLVTVLLISVFHISSPNSLFAWTHYKWVCRSGGHIFTELLCLRLLDRRSGSSPSPRRNKVRLTPERTLDMPPRHSPSPKAHRLDTSPTEPVPNFAKVSANAKYPGLHNRGSSREVGYLYLMPACQAWRRKKLCLSSLAMPE